jgi:hypothetical protein
VTVHPAPYRIKLSRSVVDTTETTTKSGIHVVQNVDPADMRVLRGVVEELGAHVEEDFPELQLGSVLFYLTAIRLGDHDFVVASWDNIVAWED